MINVPFFKLKMHTLILPSFFFFLFYIFPPLEEVIVKENSVKLMTMQPKVKVLMAQKDSTSLAVRNEELTLRQSASVMSDCTCKFKVHQVQTHLFIYMPSYLIKSNILINFLLSS